MSTMLMVFAEAFKEHVLGTLKKRVVENSGSFEGNMNVNVQCTS